VFAASKKKDEAGEDTEARIFVRVKSNIGPDGGALTYTLNTTELPQGITTSRVSWGGKVEGSARDILADAEQSQEESAGRTERDEAAAFLRSILADKPIKASQVLREAKDAGHSERTIRRAKDDLGIKAVKEGMEGGWVWQLPKVATTSYTKTVAAFGDGGSLRDPKMATNPEDGQHFASGEDGRLRDGEVF
jgi:putative DNA primase/helicase